LDLVVVALCTFLFTSPDWVGGNLYLWTMVVTLFVSMLGICANFLGWLGLRASNAPLVSMFSSGVVFMQVRILFYVIPSFSFVMVSFSLSLLLPVCTL
jgi:hypothetical protein